MVNIPGHHLVLSASILISALIISGSIFFAASSFQTSLAGLTVAPVLTGDTGEIKEINPTPNPSPTPDPTPEPDPTINLAGVMKDPSFVEGNPNAEIVIVEFSDLQCPFCRRFYTDALVEIRKNYIDTGKAQLYFQDFPLSFHPQAQVSAEAIRCAEDQGKGEELHDAIFELQIAKGGNSTIQYTVDEIKAEAQKLGLNASQFNSCVDSGAKTQEVKASFSLGSASGINGTPSFIVGKRGGTGQIIVGAQPYSTFQAALDSLAS